MAIMPEQVREAFGENFQLVSCLLLICSHVILICYLLDRISRWHGEPYAEIQSSNVQLNEYGIISFH